MAIERPKLKVAVAGTSFGALVQIPVFQSHPRTEVIAVSSGTAERAEETAKKFGIRSHYTNFEEMIEKAKPDLVSIATPPIFHCPMSIAALKRGIHVLCEKPFAMNAEEAKEMLAAAKAERVAMVDFEFRFLPARAYARDLIRNGYLGEIRMAEFMVHASMRLTAPDTPWNWWADETMGGGALGALGSHAVDTLWLLMGLPRRVFCDLVTFVKDRSGKPVTSDDSYSLLIEFQSGSRASIQMTTTAGVNDTRFGIYGTDGQLVISDWYGSELFGGKQNEGRVGPLEIPEHYRLPAEDAPLRPPFRALVNELVDAIDNQRPSPSPSFVDGLNSQLVVDAARISAREGRWVEIQMP